MTRIKPVTIENERLIVLLIVIVTVLFTLFIISAAKTPCRDKLGPGLCMDDANIVLCEIRIKSDCSMSYAKICQNGNCLNQIVPGKKSLNSIVNGTRVIR